MKKSVLLCIALLLMLAGCGNVDTSPLNPTSEKMVTENSEETEFVAISQKNESDGQAQTEVPEPADENAENQEMMNINLTIGEKTFAVTMADNEAARAFFDALPLTLSMDELHGYSYTPLGEVMDVSELAGAVGNGSVAVTFDVTK